MAPSSFLITGASSGLGAHMAIAALKAGHCVVATARNVSQAQKSHPSISQLGGVWLPLDVTSSSAAGTIESAVAEHNVNVLINNAGYALRGVCEDLSVDQYRQQFETNLFGVIAATRAALPYFRAQHFGNACIVNISSTAGLTGSAGYTAYAASKFALEGFSESLSAELKDVGVRVLLIEPAGFRTNFQAAAAGAHAEMNAAYRGTASDLVIRDRKSQHGREEGDPEKAGRAIVEAVTLVGDGAKTEGLLRLPLAKGGVARTEAKIEDLRRNLEAVRGIAEGAVFDK